MKVIVIVMDGLQCAAIGPYGNDWTPTPHFNQLANEAVVFDMHFADVPRSDKCSSAFFVRHRFPGSPVAPQWNAKVTCRSASLNRESNELVELGRSPDGVYVFDFQNLAPPWNPPDEFLEEQFEQWEFDVEPYATLELVPDQFEPENEVALASIRLSYSAVVRQVDALLGDILAKLDPEDLVVATSGRGINLGEHGIVGDSRPWLHEELVHLPLIIRLPRREQAGRRVAHLTQSIDIGPTILDALSQPILADWHGHSLLPLCYGGPAVRDYVVMGLDNDQSADFALQTIAEKIIIPDNDAARQWMYFAKPDDRCEVSNLLQPNLDRAEALEQTLRAYVAASRRDGPLQPPPLPQPETQHADSQTGR